MSVLRRRSSKLCRSCNHRFTARLWLAPLCSDYSYNSFTTATRDCVLLPCDLRASNDSRISPNSTIHGIVVQHVVDLSWVSWICCRFVINAVDCSLWICSLLCSSLYNKSTTNQRKTSLGYRSRKYGHAKVTRRSNRTRVAVASRVVSSSLVTQTLDTHAC